MSINVIYQLFTDNVAGSATSVTATTGDSAYPAANLYDRNPAKPAKLTGTTGNWVWDFSSARRVDLVALIHHNLTAGLNVRIQGNAANSWGTPTFDQAITIPAYRNDGYPRNPWLDLTSLSGYSASGFRYWRLVIVGANAANVAIGEVWFGSSIRRLDPNIQWGERRTTDRKLIELPTDAGVVHAYDLGVTQRTLVGALDATDAIAEDVLAWWESTRGRLYPFLLIPDGSVNDAWLVRWGRATTERTLQFLDRNAIPLEFEELSRGLVL